jgi:hypothetical protein
MGILLNLLARYYVLAKFSYLPTGIAGPCKSENHAPPKQKHLTRQVSPMTE